MELQGETLIAAPRERVWVALNNPDVLRRCIDGVESLDKVADNRFEGKLNAKVGPVRASFTGGVDLQDLDPPNSYTIVGEGKGGVAGFAKGSADVKLADEALADGGTGTRLTYVARSTVGGKLAQLGARLIEGTARSYAETFFARLKAEVEAPAPPPAFAPAGFEETPANLGIGSDTGEAVAANVAEIPTTMAPEGPLPPMATADADDRAGIPPIVWGGALTLLLILFTWFMLAQ
jgi:carbon monoxide dehydrogenase subunit G